MKTYNDALAAEVMKLIDDLDQINEEDKTKLEKKLEEILSGDATLHVYRYPASKFAVIQLKDGTRVPCTRGAIRLRSKLRLIEHIDVAHSVYAQ